MRRRKDDWTSKGVALRLVRGLLGPNAHVTRINEKKVESGWYNDKGEFKHKHYGRDWNELVAKLLKSKGLSAGA